MVRLRECVIDECEGIAGKPGTARGMCGKHYRAFQAHGDPLVSKKRPRTFCSVDSCDERAIGRGWCSKHWTRWQRYGDPLFRIPGEVRDGKRICSKCGEDKPVDMYGRNNNPPSRGVQNRVASGLNSHCRACSAASRQEWRADNPGYHYKADEPLYYAEATRRWRVRNPDKVKAATQARRARRVGATVEEFGPTEIFERDQWICHICARSIDATIEYPDPLSRSIDHVIPLARGGDHSRANVRAAHLRCNVRKRDKVAA